MPGLEPASFADHRSEGIGNIFPGDPVVPAEGAPGEGFIADFELRLEGQAMSGGDRGGTKIGRHRFQRVEVDAVGADLFQKFDERGRWRSAFFVRAGIPGQDGKEHFDIVTMKISDEFLECRKTTRQIAEEIELVSVVHANIGIDVPEKHGVDRAEAGFGFGKEFFRCVLASFRIVDGAVPDEKLDLREHALRPGEIGIGIIGQIHAELRAALRAPGLHAREPGGVGRISGASKEDFGG